MTPNLSDKWGSKETWLRALYLRANLIWVFRQELVGLELDQLHWLGAILDDAYLTITTQANRYANNDEGFDACLEWVRNNIEQRIGMTPEDPELHRLSQLTYEAHPSDVIQEIFDRLAVPAQSIYRSGPRRKVRLLREWLNTHPVGSVRPGDFRDPYHVDALTNVRQQLSEIELRVHLDNFTPGHCSLSQHC